jgi:hypothetical protein
MINKCETKLTDSFRAKTQLFIPDMNAQVRAAIVDTQKRAQDMVECQETW